MTAERGSYPEGAWRIQLDVGETYANALVPPVPTLPRGDTATYRFKIYTDPTTEDREDTITHIDRYEQLLRYNENAGSYVEKPTPSNRYTFEEQRPADSRSLLVRLKPTYNESGVRGVWGLIDDISDETINPYVEVTLDMSIYKLADADTYPDRTSIRNDLEYKGP